MKGRVDEHILHKRGRQVQKFFKHNGYGINVDDLHEINGIVLETKYDGKLFTSVSNLRENGITHYFGEEKQLILPVQYWRQVK